MYKCRECGEIFDEPYEWLERHGLDHGPYEPWSACPFCGSCDYDDRCIVETEEQEVDEE